MKQESELWNTEVMLKTQPLCTGAESNLGDRVLGEAEKNSFIVLPGKAGHSRLLPLKTVCPHPAGFGEEFYTNSSRVGLLIRLGCVQGLHSFNLVSGNLFSLQKFNKCLVYYPYPMYTFCSEIFTFLCFLVTINN